PYHYDKNRKFSCPLTLNELYPFSHEVKGILASVDAYPAAFNGKLDVVKKFINDHPALKDKPGLWGTTLLYSSARNNHMEIVKYLIMGARCSVDAQNQRQLAFALHDTGVQQTDVSVSPTAASTALHGACFNGHLEIVEYLVLNGANYFLQNQAFETPIMNGEHQPRIKQFFQKYLILNYSSPQTNASLPDKTISDDERKGSIIDCVWEYKPVSDNTWYVFPENESKELHKSLIPNQPEFATTIHLRVRQGVYSISMMNFLRSGKDMESKNNLAWIRCRGSSALNFDTYSLWEIMLTKHSKAEQNTTPSLKTLTIPAIHDSRFKLQLNSWYSCGAKSSSLLDDAMNYRRKQVTIDIDYIGDKLKFDLQTFSFKSDNELIIGYIRWVPKLISGIEKTNIVDIDNFQSVGDSNAIPLTTRRLAQASVTKTDQQLQRSEMNDDEEILKLNDDDNEDDDETDKEKGTTSNNGTWTLEDLIKGNESSDTQQLSLSSMQSKDPDTISINSNDYFNETVARQTLPQLLEKSNSTANAAETAAITAKLEAENKDLKEQMALAQVRVQEQIEQTGKMSQEKQNQLDEALRKLDQLQSQQVLADEKQKLLANITKTIKTIEYDIQSILGEFLLTKMQSTNEYLKQKKISEYEALFADRLPQINIMEKGNDYMIRLTGFQVHHTELKLILSRIQTLVNVIQSAKDYYKRQLNKTIRTITKNILSVKPMNNILNWKRYVELFMKLLQDKSDEYNKIFNEHINKNGKRITEPCIVNSIQPWIELKTVTDKFMKDNIFNNEVEQLKHVALDEFIKNLFVQELKVVKKPTPKSISVAKNFIEK
ncbi:unnamed protein product, partial [Didymodactylos carnosus]